MSIKKLISIAGANYARGKALGEIMSKDMAKYIFLSHNRPGAMIVFKLIKGKFLRYLNQNKGS